MKQLVLTIALLHFVATAFSQVYKNNDLTITELEDDLWVVETVDFTTMYIIEGKDRALLIDTGTDCEKLDEVVRKITDKPLYVVLTHVHVDHAGNISDFDDIYFHRDDSVLMDRLTTHYEGNIHFVEDGDIFDLGGKQVIVSHMPGHTPGSIVLLDYNNGSAFTGDAFGSGQVWCQLWPFSPMMTYALSCKKMLGMMDQGISKIYCGHYPYVKKAYDKSYMQDMYELAVLIDAGKQPDPQPHPAIIPGIGAKDPMMSTLGSATIVYDPEHIK